jgi:hypothetical protein
LNGFSSADLYKPSNASSLIQFDPMSGLVSYANGAFQIWKLHVELEQSCGRAAVIELSLSSTQLCKQGPALRRNLLPLSQQLVALGNEEGGHRSGVRKRISSHSTPVTGVSAKVFMLVETSTAAIA